MISDNFYVSVPEWFLFLYFKYWYFRSLKHFWDCDFNFVNVLELHHSMENDKWYNKQSFDLAFHFSFNQNKLWTNWRSNRALLYNKPRILYQWKQICTFMNLTFSLSRRTTVIQDLLVRRQFSLVPDNRTNVNVEASKVMASST